MEGWDEICAEVVAAGHPDPGGVAPLVVGGGCINECWSVGTRARYFLKRNDPEFAGRFEAEADGLRELRSAGALRVPEPICAGVAVGRSFLVLEHLQLGGTPDGRRMGELLARQHRHTSTDGRFGWHRDNAIGETPQPNGWSESWAGFLRDRRLGHMVRLARRKGVALPGADHLLGDLERFFSDHNPTPSLLHGDLWSGNVGFVEGGAPAVFDPACYFGDREADIAFTEMFGGFGRDFYAGYQDAWPLDPGYEDRRDLYNLYHVLNHYVLFGGGYGAQAERIVTGLVA